MAIQISLRATEMYLYPFRSIKKDSVFQPDGLLSPQKVNYCLQFGHQRDGNILVLISWDKEVYSLAMPFSVRFWKRLTFFGWNYIHTHLVICSTEFNRSYFWVDIPSIALLLSHPNGKQDGSVIRQTGISPEQNGSLPSYLHKYFASHPINGRC